MEKQKAENDNGENQKLENDTIERMGSNDNRERERDRRQVKKINRKAESRKQRW